MFQDVENYSTPEVCSPSSEQPLTPVYATLKLLVGEVNPSEMKIHFRKSICDALESTLRYGVRGSSVSVLRMRSMDVVFARASIIDQA